MTRIITGVLICFLAGMIVQADSNGYQELSDQSGRSLQVKLLKYDDVKKQLLIQTENGRQTWVSPSIFSEESAKYVWRWIETDRVLSDRSLQVTIRKRLDDDRLHYELTLDNRTGNSLPALKADYVIYVRQDGQNGTKDQIRCVGGKLEIEAIPPRKKVTFDTKSTSMKLRSAPVFDGGRSSDTVKLSEDKPLGVWIKIYGPFIDGVPCERDICFPAELSEKVSWAEHLFISHNVDTIHGF
ncbi:MAG: hypothetical protein JXR25_01890 [Pontiellaceae bacterium]|nr:hypothetical protein [Pontiellaceae bacterium]MBN2783550.1 hypothetical protein [Pontiellaceae bacterium]